MRVHLKEAAMIIYILLFTFVSLAAIAKDDLC